MYKNAQLANAGEIDMISRKVLVWINTFPDAPVALINYENLPADQEGMALSTIQSGISLR